MVSFGEMVFWLDQVGVADILLPFLLVFVIAYAVLMKTEILGKAEKAKRFNVVIALVMGFAVVVPHVLLGTHDDKFDAVLVNGYVDIVEVINKSLPQVSVVIVAIVMLLLMLGTFGIKWKLGESGGGSAVVVLSLIVIVYIFGTSAGWFFNGRFPRWLYFLHDPNTVALIVTLLVFGVVVWLITREERPERKGFFERLQKALPTEDLDK